MPMFRSCRQGTSDPGYGGGKRVNAALASSITTSGQRVSSWSIIVVLAALSGRLAEAAQPVPLNYNPCGDDFFDVSNIQWYGKNFIFPTSAGATCFNTTNPISVDPATCTMPGCQQPQLQQMFQFSGAGPNLTYDAVSVGSLTNPNTNFQVTLYFAEYMATAVGQRVFDIVINGATVASDVDVFALSGGSDRGMSLPFIVNSGSSPTFDISLPTKAGGDSILAGLSFGFASDTNLTSIPANNTLWGSMITFVARVSSLNPGFVNVTAGFVTFTTFDGIIFGTAFLQGQPDGTGTGELTFPSSFFGNCSGGTYPVTATFSGDLSYPALVYSLDQSSFSLEAACPTTNPAPTTSTPAVKSSTPAPTTTTPAITSTLAPTTTPSTSTTPATTTTNPPTTTESPTTTTPGVTTSEPPTTTSAPSTTPANPTSTPVISSTTPALVTTTPLTSTTPPPTSAAVEITLVISMEPNPPVPGQPLTISGEAVASSGPPPTGNITVYVDGIPVATTEMGNTGRRLLQSSSPFSITIIAPSTPGVHIITVVFFPSSGGSSGGGTPVVAPVTVIVDVGGLVASVALAVSSSALHFPSCTDPVRVVGSVTGSNGTAPPSGIFTLSISGLNSPAAGAMPLNVTLASASVTGGAAEFVLKPRSHTAAAVQALTGADKSPSAKLLPGSYQLTAAYSGDALYGPASGSASLDVGATCPLVTLTA